MPPPPAPIFRQMSPKIGGGAPPAQPPAPNPTLNVNTMSRNQAIISSCHLKAACPSTRSWVSFFVPGMADFSGAWQGLNLPRRTSIAARWHRYGGARRWRRGGCAGGGGAQPARKNQSLGAVSSVPSAARVLAARLFQLFFLCRHFVDFDSSF